MADRLGEIRARVGAASPGPWWAKGHKVLSLTDAAGEKPVDVSEAFLLANCWSGQFAPRPGIADSNAAFIANSPDDIRFLLAEVERLRAERDALRLALNRARALLGGQSDGR